MKIFARILLSVLLLVAPLGATALSVIKVGVMLPFKKGAAVSRRAVDFYRGLMMSVDSLKHTGYSFQIYAYNTAEKPLNSILADPIIPQLDIIFAPDDAMQLKTISDFTRGSGVKVVDAFCPKTSALQSNPNLFVLYPADNIVADDAASLLMRAFAKANIVIVDTGKPSHSFVTAIKQQFGKVRFLKAGFTQSQLESRLSKKKRNFIIASSADYESASALLRDVAQFRKSGHADYSVSVVGYSEWQNHQSSLQLNLHAADTYLYTPFFNNQNSARNVAFFRAYQKNFREKPASGQPSMALYGFDSGYYLFKGLARYGRAYAGEAVYAAPLQNGFNFGRFGNSGGMVNHMVQYVHYKSDGTVELVQNK